MPLQVQERFVLHFTDEEAVHYMQNLIDDSVNSMMPALMEQVHRMAQVCLHFLFCFNFNVFLLFNPTSSKVP